MGRMIKMLTIRPVQRCESEALFRLYRQASATPGCTWGEGYPNGENIQEDLALKALHGLWEGEGLLGAVSVGPFGELDELPFWEAAHRPWELARLCVHPKAQGRGLAARLLRYGLDLAYKGDADSLRLLVSPGNEAAIRLYEANGFIRCGEALLYDLDFYGYERRLRKG